MSRQHWLIEALQEGLRTMPLKELVHKAADHAKVEGEWAPRKVRPSLIAQECRLARLKSFRGHDPQPGQPMTGAVRQGLPSAGTALHFLRGYFAEGMAVAALNAVSQTYQTYDIGGQRMNKGLGLYAFDCFGCSPWTVFEHHGWTATLYPTSENGYQARDVEYQAHPDVVIMVDGKIELIQMKCPSVHAFSRYQRDGGQSVRRRYGPQAVAEMYVGRQMGLPILRNHILVFALEGSLPGSDQAKAGQEVLALVETVEWIDQMEREVESIAEEILEDDAQAEKGEWPVAYPLGTKWPCDYCTWPRVQTSAEQVTCEENQAWDSSQSTSSVAIATSPTRSSTTAHPPALPPPATPSSLPSPALPPTPSAGTPNSYQSPMPPPLPASAPPPLPSGSAPSSGLQPLSRIRPPALPGR